MELVSIIIPTYNHANYLSDAITSALTQSWANCEIIVVDDGSTDHTAQVVEWFGERVRYIRQENRGLPGARNTGLAQARGHFIALLDADDMFEPRFVETMVTALRQNTTAGVAYCGFRYIDANGHDLPQEQMRIVPTEQLPTELLKHDFLVPAAVFAYKACYDHCGLFDETLHASEDWDMWLRFSQVYTIIGVPEILVRYRVLPNSMSTNPARMLNARLTVIGKILGPEPGPAGSAYRALTADGSNPKEAQARYSYADAYVRAAIEYLMVGEEAQAIFYLGKSGIQCPALLLQEEVMYELGMGKQARGARGHFSQVEVTRANVALIRLLDRLFAHPRASEGYAGYQRAIYANAYAVLGKFNYAIEDFPAARYYLLRSMLVHPLHGFSQQRLALLAKTMLGTEMVNHLRAWREQHEM